jgi:hypothetical protein
MSAQGGGLTIGSQVGVTINNAARDQIIDNPSGTLTIAPQGAVADLRGALQAAVLPDPVRLEAERALDAVEAELDCPGPDKRRIGSLVEGLTDTLKEAGALATAAESLLSPLKVLMSWLGPAGAAALRLLSQA